MTLTAVTKLFRQVQHPRYGLAGIGVSLGLLNLCLAWLHTKNADLVAIMALFWCVVGYLIWERWRQLPLHSDRYSTGAGILLISWALYKSWGMSDYDPFVRIQPVIFLLGLGLLGSGAKRLWRYRKELCLFLVLALPEGILAQWLTQAVDISVVAAQSATALLWYLGLEVQRHGVYVQLPGGSVEVYQGCSGLKAMLELLRLSLMFLVIFPTNLLQKLVVPLIAMGLAYSINVVRIALMAVLAASQRKVAFEYWHVGDGSNLFPIAAMMLFALFCMLLLRFREAQDQSCPHP